MPSFFLKHPANFKTTKNNIYIYLHAIFKVIINFLTPAIEYSHKQQ